jgi:chromosomal replication initiator protein
MSNKKIQQIFTELLNDKFVELGFSKSTALKITKLILQYEIIENSVISICPDAFYRDQVIGPQTLEIDKIVKKCWGPEFSFRISSHSLQDSSFEKSKKVERKHKKNHEDQSLSILDIHTDNIFELNSEILKENSKKSSRSLEPSFNFSTFVRCQSNFAAYTACETVANNPGNLSNPLFLYGSTGLGKTHLLHSVGNEILKTNPTSNILYITSNDFVNDVIHKGIKSGKMEEVRKKYNSCDVLLVDDIQFLENKDACQVEFFHTFNELCQKKKQIVITCDKFPKDIPNIEERLKSRFLQGLLVDIEPPGFEDRVALIEIKSKQLSLDLDESECFLIASHAKTNVREIEGLLKDLFIAKETNKNHLSNDLVLNILKRRFPSQTIISDIDIQFIQKSVAQHYQIKMSELMGQMRQKKLVQARHVAMYLAKELLNLQVVEISEAFGKKDHTTALHAISKIKDSIEKDTELKENIFQIKRKLDEKTV